jgi:hypothetical protein
MIPALIACFFGAALTAACDPQTKPPFDIVPTFGAGDDVVGPGACSEAKSEQACAGTVTCVWSNDRCAPMTVAAP